MDVILHLPKAAACREPATQPASFELQTNIQNSAFQFTGMYLCLSVYISVYSVHIKYIKQEVSAHDLVQYLFYFLSVVTCVVG